MSYAQNQHSRRGRQPKRPRPFRLEESRRSAMGDNFLDVLSKAMGISAPDPCAAARDRATAGLDAQTNDLARTWAASDGLYTVAGMAAVRDRTMALLLQASKALDAALAGATTDLISNIRQAQTWIYAKESASLKFTTAINAAVAQGVQTLSAPDFKDWVLGSMNKASVGIGFATYADCIKPGVLVALIQGFNVAWAATVAAAKALVKVVVKTAEVIMKIPDAALDVVTYAKYGAAAFAAYWLYTKVKRG